MSYSSTIISLAWPDTKVAMEGKWYDVPLRWLGANKNGKYIAGHAAFLLVNHNNNKVYYFDYGRYHTPTKFGRVRDEVTDPDLGIKQEAIIREGGIENITELLMELYNNKACHGTGRLNAAVVKNIDFTKAYSKVKQMQNRGAINYGPFAVSGSTCSRLVAQVVLVSTNNWLTKLMIRLPYTLSVTPRSNIKVLNDMPYYYEVDNKEVYRLKSKFFKFKTLFVRSLKTNYNFVLSNS